jgi:glyoxylase-like metal-dependent hydrolase (beta-lactamase superfamily II)
MNTSADLTAQPFRLGDIEVITVADGSLTFPLPDGLVRNATRNQVNEALEAAGMKRDEMKIVFNPVVLRTSGRTLLFDTGNGESADRGPDGPGLFGKNLTSAGISPDQIDLVVITHFHGDHIGGLLLADGSPAFPNADIVVPEAEWTFWMSEDERSRAKGGRLEENFANVRRVLTPLKDRIAQCKGDASVAPGVVAMSTPGHTPGHTSFVVSSGAAKLFIQGDVTNHPALFVRHPGWHLGFDMDPDLAERTRRTVYEMLLAERMPVQGFHFPFPSRGFVERDGDGYRLSNRRI